MQMQVDQVSNIVVLDIGSRGGLHRSWHHFAFPIELYFFEPEPEGFEALSNACATEGGSGNVYHVMNAAVDGGTGERVLNIYSNPLQVRSSSTLQAGAIASKITFSNARFRCPPSRSSTWSTGKA
jgi:hypothetical protein